MLTRRMTVMVAALLAGALAGCNSGTKSTSDRDLALISRLELQRMLNDEKRREGLVVIDVRKPAEYAEAHIPGAVNIRVIDLHKSDPRLAEAKMIVVYGSGDPNDLLSWAAAKKLVAMGYVNVQDFRGGMEEWLGRRSHQAPLIDRRMEEKANTF